MSKEREEALRESHLRSEESRIDTFESWIIDLKDSKDDECCEDTCDS